MKRRALCLIVVGFVFAGISGCVHETVDGPTHVYTYEIWAPLSALLGGLAAVPAGWFVRKASSRFGWSLMAVGAVLLVVVAPSLFRDRVAVDQNAFSLRTGLWGLTAVHAVRFDDLKQVRIISEEVRGRRGSTTTHYYFLCERNDGTSEKVPVDNRLAQAAAPHFLRAVTDRGIPVLNET